MGVSYYDALLPPEPGAGLQDLVAGIGLPYRVLVSIGVPGGMIVLALVSTCPAQPHVRCELGCGRTGQQPDATLYALGRPARPWP